MDQMDQIIPYDPHTDPLRYVLERPYSLRQYVREHRLVEAAQAAWDMRRWTSMGSRASLLRHLCDQVVADSPSPPLRPMRFLELRDVLNAYEDSKTFAELVSQEDWSDIEWEPLQRFIALYIEPQGEDGPYFSSRVFHLHYLDAHGMSPPG